MTFCYIFSEIGGISNVNTALTICINASSIILYTVVTEGTWFYHCFTTLNVEYSSSICFIPTEPAFYNWNCTSLKLPHLLAKLNCSIQGSITLQCRIIILKNNRNTSKRSNIHSENASFNSYITTFKSCHSSSWNSCSICREHTTNNMYSGPDKDSQNSSIISYIICQVAGLNNYIAVLLGMKCSSGMLSLIFVDLTIAYDNFAIF